MEIDRTDALPLIDERFAYSTAVAILGPRQSGKTTLAKQFADRIKKGVPVHYFDLEDNRDLEKFKDPYTTLSDLEGYIVIDEIQRSPELFPTLRVLIDKKPDTKYLILGSASRDLIKQSSETLAGRISYVELRGLSMDLVPDDKWRTLWSRGGFPKSFLYKSDEESFSWRKDYISTFLERDIPSFGFRVPGPTMLRAWTMLAHLHGQILNASGIGRSLGTDEKTARHYVDILTETLVVRQLYPWYTNTKKRLIKHPKTYIRDSGILHALLGINDLDGLTRHPILGFSFEGFVLEKVMQHLNLRSEESYFWGAHSGGEIDLVWQDHGKMWGVEVKHGDVPKITKSLEVVMEEMDLAHIWIVYPGTKKYQIHERVTCLPVTEIGEIGPSRLM